MPLFKPDVAKLSRKRDVKALVNVLYHRDPSFRGEAAEALGGLRAADALDALMAALADGDAFVRRRAAAALGQIGQAAGVESLCGALHDDDDDVRIAAAEALGGIGDPRAVRSLLEALGSTAFVVAGYTTPWDAAHRALQTIGAAALEPLIDALADPDDHVRFQAARALGDLDDPRAVAPLAGMLDDPEPAVRWFAARALAQSGDTRAVGLLLEFVGDGTWKTNPWADEAIMLLGEFGDARAVEPLIAILDKPEGCLDGTTSALGKLGDARAVEPLRAFLSYDTGSAIARVSAAQSLGALGHPVNRHELWPSPLLHEAVCDLCNEPLTPERSCVIPNDEFRTIVIRGYEPFTRGRAGAARRLGSAFGMDPEHERANWEELVMNETSDWGMCPDCADDVAGFLAGP